MVEQLVGWLVGPSRGLSVITDHKCSAAKIHSEHSSPILAGWMAGWMVGWMDGRLDGWLIGW